MRGLQILSAAAALLFVPLAAFAEDAPPVIHLWPNGAPGCADRCNEPEEAKDWWVKNIHNPSITVFLPEADKATRSAVIVMPGGGHRELVFPPEGIAPAKFLQERGVAAFALKYRLAFEEGSPYRIKDAFADAQRAVRYVRAHAEEFGVDPDRVGVMGWSAGGVLASMLSFAPVPGDPDAEDPLNRWSARPDFVMLIYPAPNGIPDKLDATPPPAFILGAYDDPVIAETRTVEKLLGLYRDAGGVAEALVYAQGGHGFNMGDRSDLKSISTWPDRMADWLSDMGFLERDGE